MNIEAPADVSRRPPVIILAILHLITGIKTEHPSDREEGSKIPPCTHRPCEILRIEEKIKLRVFKCQKGMRLGGASLAHGLDYPSAVLPPNLLGGAWGGSQRQHELGEGAGSGGLCYSGMPAKTLGPGGLTGVEKGTELGPELCDSAGHF